jgi:hypothetical protein
MDDEIIDNIQDRNKDDTSCLIDNDKITDEWLRSKYKILKNLLVIGFAWIFQFTAYQSMAILQSSLNSAGGLGILNILKI